MTAWSVSASTDTVLDSGCPTCRIRRRRRAGPAGDPLRAVVTGWWTTCPEPTACRDAWGWMLDTFLDPAASISRRAVRSVGRCGGRRPDQGSQSSDRRPFRRGGQSITRALKRMKQAAPHSNRRLVPVAGRSRPRHPRATPVPASTRRGVTRSHTALAEAAPFRPQPTIMIRHRRSGQTSAHRRRPSRPPPDRVAGGVRIASPTVPGLPGRGG